MFFYQMPCQNTFTIHFATINTVEIWFGISEGSKFTIHFATINTKKRKITIQGFNRIYNTLCYY